MDLRQLRHFVTLAETLNFRRAAERLNMAQPPLSVSIRKLEAELGGALLERTTREIHLTGLGRIFLDRARRTLFEAEQAVAAARAAVSGEQGSLTIGFVGSATYAALPQLVPAFRAAHPGVQLTLRESTTTQILAEIGQGTLDLGIIRAPVTRGSGARLDVIEEDRLVLALPASHRLARRRRVRLSELEEEPFIAYAPERVPSLNAVMMLACQKAGFVPRVTQEAIQVQTIISLVESGLGVALVPSVATRGGHHRAVFRELQELREATAISLALAYAPDWITSTARLFRDLAVGRLNATRAER